MNHLNEQIAVRFAGAGSARVCGKAVIAFDVGNSHSRPIADLRPLRWPSTKQPLPASTSACDGRLDQRAPSIRPARVGCPNLRPAEGPARAYRSAPSATVCRP
jgi:hypothetical protein